MKIKTKVVVKIISIKKAFGHNIVHHQFVLELFNCHSWLW